MEERRKGGGRELERKRSKSTRRGIRELEERRGTRRRGRGERRKKGGEEGNGDCMD